MPDPVSPFVSSLFPFVAEDLAVHQNPVTCLLYGVDRPIVVEAPGERIEGHIVLIRPGVDHSVDIRGRARVLYLNGLQFPSHCLLAENVRGKMGQLAGDAFDGAPLALDELRATLSHRLAICPADIADIVRDIANDTMVRMSQVELAKRLGMERTRALRYFQAATGMTFRSFKKWSGLQAASHRIARGELIRTAAMDAGFSDSAHLTRTFRSMFGITPSAATADLR
tara:strand:+ start:1992 stop:2669 length:678 start_codon:yes stop_codon:yes gene_type:complete